MCMSAIAIAFVVAACYGAYNFFVKLSSGAIHEIVGAVVLQAAALMLGLVMLGYLKVSGETFIVSTKGVTAALVAGLCVGLAEICSYYAFSRGLSGSVGIPIMVAGGVCVGVLLSVLFLKEVLSGYQILGIVLMLGGTVLLVR